jgi:putative FmdB family regulatory protein
MPLYDFQCRGCGHRFEELVRLGETPRCPSCGAEAAEKLFSASAAVSTGKTRSRSARERARLGKSIKREQDHAQREYERNYLKDHS